MTPLLLIAGLQAVGLQPRLPARPVVFNAVEEKTEGTTRTSLGTRFEVVAGGPLGIELTTGPFSAGKRTFGRPKTKHLELTKKATVAGDGLGRPPFLLSVPLPGRPVKKGDAWAGTLVGPTPMPAGVKVAFRALGPAKVGGAPCLKVAAKIDYDNGAKITGGGEFAVRLDDGFVQTGSLSVLIVYRRPDPVTKVMKENGRVSVKARIVRGRLTTASVAAGCPRARAGPFDLTVAHGSAATLRAGTRASRGYRGRGGIEAGT